MTFVFVIRRRLKLKQRRKAPAMNIFDLMTKDVICVHEKDSLATALDIMGQAGVHHLVVISPSGKVLGILSDRDCKIAMRSPFSEGDPKRFADLLPISYIMTP